MVCVPAFKVSTTRSSGTLLGQNRKWITVGTTKAQMIINITAINFSASGATPPSRVNIAVDFSHGQGNGHRFAYYFLDEATVNKVAELDRLFARVFAGRRRLRVWCVMHCKRKSTLITAIKREKSTLAVQRMYFQTARIVDTRIPAVFFFVVQSFFFTRQSWVSGFTILLHSHARLAQKSQCFFFLL